MIYIAPKSQKRIRVRFSRNSAIDKLTHNKMILWRDVSDLDLDPQSSKPNQFICHLNYIISRSLVKFRPLVCICINSKISRGRTNTRTHGSTHALTEVQSKNIMPPRHLLVADGGTKKLIIALSRKVGFESLGKHYGATCSWCSTLGNARCPSFRCRSSVAVSPFPLAVSVHRCRCVSFCRFRL